MVLPLVLSIASLVLSAFMCIYFSTLIRKHFRREDILRDYREETNRLIADIDAATERDSRIVEERIAAMNAVLEDVKKRTAVFVRELEKRQNGERLYTELGKKQVVPPSFQAKPVVEPVLPPGRVLPEEAPPASPPVPAPAVSAKTVYASPEEEAAALSLQGYSPAAIASKLKKSILEVELALSLYGEQDREM